MSKKLLTTIAGLLSSIFVFGQTSYDPPLLTNPLNDTSICAGNSLVLHAEISPSNPIGVDPGEGEGGGKIEDLTDDVFSSVIDLGFTFKFYGVEYTQCVASSNNYISFNTSLAGTGSGWAITDPAPSTNTPATAIMCPWQDINPGIGGLIQYQTIGEAPNRVFVIEYCDVPMFSCTEMSFSNQIKLFEGSNVIETHIIDKPLCETWNDGNAIHGLSKNATLAHIVPGRNYPDTWTAVDDGYRFTPDPANPDNYFMEPILYSPFMMNVTNSDIVWFEEGNPEPIGSGMDITVTPTHSPTYYVASITSGGDCNGVTYTDTIRVDFNAIFYDTVSAAICKGLTYDFYGTPVFESGMYQTTLTSPEGCDTTITLFLTNNPLPSVEFAGSQTDICEGESARLSVQNPTPSASYQWIKDGYIISGATQHNYEANTGGVYRVTAISNRGCVDTSKRFTLMVNPAAKAEITHISEQNVCIGDTVTILANAGDEYTYQWSPESIFRYTTGSLQQRAEAIVPTSYQPIYLVAMNRYGCRAYDTAYVSAHPCCDIFMPTAFTPNNDGTNDYFAPSIREGQRIIALQVFDRRGALVYDNANGTKGWDGRYPNGDEAPQTVYMYRFIYTCTDGEVYETKGDLTLIR